MDETHNGSTQSISTHHTPARTRTRPLRRDRLHQHEAVALAAVHMRERAGGGLGPAYAREHGEGHLALWVGVCGLVGSVGLSREEGRKRVRLRLSFMQSTMNRHAPGCGTSSRSPRSARAGPRTVMYVWWRMVCWDRFRSTV